MIDQRMGDHTEYLPYTDPEDAGFEKIIAQIKNRPASLHGVCRKCSQKMEFPTEAMGRKILCPNCGDRTTLWNNEFFDLIQKHQKAEYDEVFREYQKQACPNCGSHEYDIYHPSKPLVLTPMTFGGILAGGAANVMADRIFKPEKVCLKCGHRWPL